MSTCNLIFTRVAKHPHVYTKPLWSPKSAHPAAWKSSTAKLLHLVLYVLQKAFAVRTLALEVGGTFALASLWSKLKAACKLLWNCGESKAAAYVRRAWEKLRASQQLSDLALHVIHHVKEQICCLGERSKWARVHSPYLAWNKVLPNWIRVSASDTVWATGNTAFKELPKNGTPIRILPAHFRAQQSTAWSPTSQNGSWSLSPLDKSLAVLSVIGLAVCCQPWIFCGDWNHFCYHNGTRNENVVRFSVQYGSVDHLPRPHRY